MASGPRIAISMKNGDGLTFRPKTSATMQQPSEALDRERRMRRNWGNELIMKAQEKRKQVQDERESRVARVMSSSSSSKLFALQGRGGFNSSLALSSKRSTAEFSGPYKTANSPQKERVCTTRPESAGAFVEKPLAKTLFRKYCK